MDELEPTIEAPRTSEAFEALVEEFLIALGEGREPDAEAYAGRLSDDRERRRFLVVVAAETALDRERRGEKVDLNEAFGHLSKGEQREAIAYVHRSRRAEVTHSRPLPPGELLAGRFRVQKQFASGGTAAVYLVRDEEFDVDRILKAFNHGGSEKSAAEWEELLLAEARTLARLESRHIVTVHDIFRDGAKSYIVMDYLRGADLHRVIRSVAERRDREGKGARPDGSWMNEAIDEEVRGEYSDILATRGWHGWYRCAARIARYAVGALELAHNEGICHRDLKPANIYLVGGGEPVLLDFGFGSGPGGMESLEERLIGTPQYMAPEQFRRGRIGSDPRTDVYQMGVVLYELVTLRCPYDPRTEDFVDKKRAGKYERPREIDPSIPKALAAIIDKAMSAELEDRYTSAREMRIDLERFEAGKPPLFAEVEGAARAVMWGNWLAHRPTFLISVAAALVVLLVYQFRPDAWVPPEVEARHRVGGALPERSAELQPLRWDGGSIDLALLIDPVRKSHVYAFEVFGMHDGVRFLRPLAWEPGEYSLAVERTQATPVLTLDGEGPRWPIEELFVLALERESPVLDEYIREIEGDLGRGIDVAFDPTAFERILTSPTRGTARADMPASQRRALEAVFDPGAEPSEQDYAKAGVKPFRFEYHIDYGEERE